jgi:hypothetical protein
MALALTERRLVVLSVSPPLALGKGGDVKELVSAVTREEVEGSRSSDCSSERSSSSRSAGRHSNSRPARAPTRRDSSTPSSVPAHPHE